MCPESKFPLGSLSARKSVSKLLTYYIRGGKQFVRRYIKPSGLPSADQLAQREVIKLKVEAWQALSPSAKAEWNAEAKELGDPWSGYTLYIRSPIVSVLDFLDNFEDDSIYWAWRLHNIDANRTILEAGNLLTISIANGATGDFTGATNTAPKAIIGLMVPPLTIIFKLNSFVVNDDVLAGIVFSTNIVGTTSNYCYIGRIRNDSTPIDGLTAYVAGGHNYVVNPTMPVWFRIRINSLGRYGTKWIFDYSHNGTSWTNFLTQNDPLAGWCANAALIGRNWGVHNAISAPFEFFQMTPCLGPR